jgi:hypothetical protein
MCRPGLQLYAACLWLRHSFDNLPPVIKAFLPCTLQRFGMRSVGSVPPIGGAFVGQQRFNYRYTFLTTRSERWAPDGASIPGRKLRQINVQMRIKGSIKNQGADCPGISPLRGTQQSVNTERESNGCSHIPRARIRFEYTQHQ